MCYFFTLRNGMGEVGVTKCVMVRYLSGKGDPKQ